MVLNIDLYNLDHLAKNNLKRIAPYLIYKILRNIQLPIVLVSDYDYNQYRELSYIENKYEFESGFIYEKIESALYSILTNFMLGIEEAYVEILKVTPKSILLNFKGISC